MLQRARSSKQAWTPTLTFSTPGDLSVAYAANARQGLIRRLASGLYMATFNIVTSTFTHTTASGSLQVTGLPVATANVTGQAFHGMMASQGITKAGYTQFVPRLIWNTTAIDFVCNGSGVANSSVAPADTPTGGTVVLRGSILFEAF